MRVSVRSESALMILHISKSNATRLISKPPVSLTLGKSHKYLAEFITRRTLTMNSFKPHTIYGKGPYYFKKDLQSDPSFKTKHLIYLCTGKYSFFLTTTLNPAYCFSTNSST